MISKAKLKRNQKIYVLYVEHWQEYQQKKENNPGLD